MPISFFLYMTHCQIQPNVLPSESFTEQTIISDEEQCVCYTL